MSAAANSHAQPARRYRVAQWATGNIGTRSLKAIIEHPQMDLVGLYVFGDDKVGADAGSLCGMPPTGVFATRSVDEVLALQPDCVVYMPRYLDLDVVLKILRSGANVVTTRGEFHRPASLPDATRLDIEQACAVGRSSIHSTGSSPGFITEVMPLALSSIQRRLDSLTIDEYADLSRRDSPGLLFDVMGFGHAPGEFDQQRLDHLQGSFGPSLLALADALSIRIDGVSSSGEFAVARESFAIAAGTIHKGSVAAQRITVSACSDGRPVLEFRANWYCGTDIEPKWPLRSTGWHISVKGDTPLEVDMPFPFPIEEMASFSPGYTAHRAVNCIPFVCEADPGIRTTTDLGIVTAILG